MVDLPTENGPSANADSNSGDDPGVTVEAPTENKVGASEADQGEREQNSVHNGIPKKTFFTEKSISVYEALGGGVEKPVKGPKFYYQYFRGLWMRKQKFRLQRLLDPSAVETFGSTDHQRRELAKKAKKAPRKLSGKNQSKSNRLWMYRFFGKLF